MNFQFNTNVALAYNGLGICDAVIFEIRQPANLPKLNSDTMYKICSSSHRIANTHVSGCAAKIRD